MIIVAAKLIAFEIASIGVIGAGIGIGTIFGSYLLALSRNPGIKGKLFYNGLWGFASYGKSLRLIVLFSYRDNNIYTPLVNQNLETEQTSYPLVDLLLSDNLLMAIFLGACFGALGGYLHAMFPDWWFVFMRPNVACKFCNFEIYSPTKPFFLRFWKFNNCGFYRSNQTYLHDHILAKCDILHTCQIVRAMGGLRYRGNAQLIYVIHDGSWCNLEQCLQFYY